MKKYYDREFQLDQLKSIQKKAFEEHSRMTLLKGRRRIGKTTLGRLSMEGADSVYLFVARKSESDLCEAFSNEIRTALNAFLPTGVTRFRELFEWLLAEGERRPFNLFIDEFQEFYYINPSVFSDIQDIWDRRRKESHVNLVLSGSSYTLMERIFRDQKEPLFGRADLTIEMEPFATTVLKEILRDHKADYDNDDLLALYCFTGGVPKYVELFMDNGCTDMESMVDYMVLPGSLFIEEGERILIQEMGKNYGTYFSILDRIAADEVTLPQIEGSLGNRNLAGQMKLLEEEYHLIAKKRPLRSGEHTKDVRYELSDVFLRFWFRYFDRHRNLLEIKNYLALRDIIKKDYKTYSGRVLERWFRQKLMESQSCTEIGGWWKPVRGAEQNPREIDLVTVDLDGRPHAYEVKRKREKYVPAVFEAKVNEMSDRLFGGRPVDFSCLTMEDM